MTTLTTMSTATTTPVGPAPVSTKPGAPRPLTVRTLPAAAPRLISADDAWSRPTHIVQDALALDFFAPDPEGDFDRQPSLRSQLDDPYPFVAKMAQAIIEVVLGQRPAPQLIRHTTPPIYAVLARRALVSSRRQTESGRRAAVVRRVRLCEPADGIIEACAVVVSPGRVRALALRVEGLDGRWIITQLTIG